MGFLTARNQSYFFALEVAGPVTLFVARGLGVLYSFVGFGSADLVGQG